MHILHNVGAFHEDGGSIFNRIGILLQANNPEVQEPNQLSMIHLRTLLQPSQYNQHYSTVSCNQYRWTIRNDPLLKVTVEP
jgi:hypothetical protein